MRRTVRYLAPHIGQFVLVVFLAVTLNFAIPRLIPGDPIELALGRLQQSLGGGSIDVNQIADQYRAKYGLDKPILEQYLAYWGDVLRGDLGYSLAALDERVVDKVAFALPWTIGLLVTSTLMAFALGTALGALMSWPRYGRLARWATVPFMVVAAVPQYLLAVILVGIFAVWLQWFPAAGGMSTVTVAALDASTALDIARHAFLPALALVLGSAGFWAMGMRANMVSILGNDYITFAEAKGLSPSRVFLRYGVRNALLPQITALALTLGTVVSGAILVEVVFNYPGLGGLLYAAISSKDYFVVQGITLFLVLSTAMALLILDLIYPLLDPRVRTNV